MHEALAHVPKKIWVIVAIMAAAAVILAIAAQARKQGGAESQAGYGYPRLPRGAKVDLQARVAGSKKYVSDSLVIQSGQTIELQWSGKSVDTCSSRDGWTNFTGPRAQDLSFGPVYSPGITFVVDCSKDGFYVASDHITVTALDPQ